MGVQVETMGNVHPRDRHGRALSFPAEADCRGSHDGDLCAYRTPKGFIPAAPAPSGPDFSFARPFRSRHWQAFEKAKPEAVM